MQTHANGGGRVRAGARAPRPGADAGRMGRGDRRQRRARAAARRGVEAGRRRALRAASATQQLVEADRGGSARRRSSRGACGWRGWRARRDSATAPWPIASSSRRPVWARSSRATAAGCGGRDVNDNEIAKILRDSSDRERAARGLGGVEVDRPARGAARARARAPAQRGGARARLSRPLRLLADARRARRDLAAEPARRPRRPPRGDLGAHEGRDRRRPARAPRARRGRDAAALGLRRRVLPGRARRRATIRSRRRSGTSIRSRSPAPTSRRSATTSTACSRAATSTRATARTSTRSAPTSTGAHDVRILANCEPGTRWLGTMVHELGHAVYDLAIDSELPWMLRQPAHTFTTEAIAMLHGRLVRDETFLERFAGVAPEIARDPRNAEMQRRELLVFVPWVQVMTRFERELYRDPDQDLGARLVAARRALPARRAACRASGPTTGPARSTSRWRPSTTTTTCSARSRPRSSLRRWRARRARRARRSSPPRPGEFLRERFMRPGVVAALGCADRARDGRAALGRPSRRTGSRA